MDWLFTLRLGVFSVCIKILRRPAGTMEPMWNGAGRNGFIEGLNFTLEIVIAGSLTDV